MRFYMLFLRLSIGNLQLFLTLLLVQLNISSLLIFRNIFVYILSGFLASLSVTFAYHVSFRCLIMYPSTDFSYIFTLYNLYLLFKNVTYISSVNGQLVNTCSPHNASHSSEVLHELQIVSSFNRNV